MDEPCRQRTEVFSRVVGFYRPVQQWNNGKKAEFKDRKEFQAPIAAPGEEIKDAPQH
jgi:ribonucleoside-triphosphate reductase